MKVYLKSLKLHFKSELEYKASFLMNLVAQVLVFLSYYFVIISLFTKFNNIKGFTQYEVFLCFGIIHFGFSFNEVFARGIDRFDSIIANGKFDILLIRPKNILLQVLINEIDFNKIPRIIQSIIIIIIALIKLKIKMNLLKILCLLFMLFSSILIYFGIFFLAASYCFITIQGLEVRNVFTHGGRDLAQYPIGIFSKPFIFIFTFIIPYALINYYPLLYFIDKSNNFIYAFLPLIVILYVLPCIFVFFKGIKRYSSVGC